MDHVQRSKSTSRSPSITMRKAYLENSVMYTEISRCIFQGSPGDSLRETEVRGPAYYPGQKLAKNVLNLMDRGKQRWGDKRRFQISDCKFQIENICGERYFQFGMRNASAYSKTLWRINPPAPTSCAKATEVKRLRRTGPP